MIKGIFFSGMLILVTAIGFMSNNDPDPETILSKENKDSIKHVDEIKQITRRAIPTDLVEKRHSDNKILGVEDNVEKIIKTCEPIWREILETSVDLYLTEVISNKKNWTYCNESKAPIRLSQRCSKELFEKKITAECYDEFDDFRSSVIYFYFKDMDPEILPLEVDMSILLTKLLIRKPQTNKSEYYAQMDLVSHVNRILSDDFLNNKISHLHEARLYMLSMAGLWGQIPQEQWLDAIDTFQEKFPGYGNDYFLTARYLAYENLRDSTAIVDELNLFIDNNPNSSQAFYLKGRFEWTVERNKDQARFFLEKALELEPQNKKYLKSLESLNQADRAGLLYVFPYENFIEPDLQNH